MESRSLTNYRPSISDQQDVGFFRQDASCQTTTSEILDLKEMISVFQTLQNELAELRNELGISKIVLKVDYKFKLEERVALMHSRVNDRLAFLKERHSDQIDMVRRSCRTQLSDAVARISGEHVKHLHVEMEELRRDSERNAAEMRNKCTRLKKEIMYRDDALVQMKIQNAYLENFAKKHELDVQLIDVKLPAPPPDFEKERDEAINREKNKTAAVEAKLERKERLLKETRNNLKEMQATALEYQATITSRDEQIAQMEIKLEKLEGSILDANAVAEAAKARANMEADLARKAKKMAQEADQKAEDERRKKLEIEKLSEEQRKKAEWEKVAKSVQDAPQVADKTRMERLYVKKLTDLKTAHATELARAHQDLQRLNKTWERKLIITQRALSAIKDEGYMRTVLQRQAAVLQYASLMYPSKEVYNSQYQVGASRPLPQPVILPRLTGPKGHQRIPSRSAHVLPRTAVNVSDVGGVGVDLDPSRIKGNDHKDDGYSVQPNTNREFFYTGDTGEDLENAESDNTNQYSNYGADIMNSEQNGTAYANGDAIEDVRRENTSELDANSVTLAVT